MHSTLMAILLKTDVKILSESNEYPSVSRVDIPMLFSQVSYQKNEDMEIMERS